MEKSTQPFVSMLTPVYNGETYLAKSIESVIAQTYDNWEYVIIDNCSTDASGDIAERYAAQDSRIRVIHNTELLSPVGNHNFGLSQLSAESQYCKIVHADDWLFPECVERMVALGEANPSLGIIGSYYLRDRRVDPEGLPAEQSVHSGREIGRARLRRENYVFGSPTTLLIRGDVIRATPEFYDETYIHWDVDACLRVLLNHDFGFVPQVLSFTRIHEGSTTAKVAKPTGTDTLDMLRAAMQYGPQYFSASEFEDLQREELAFYYKCVARNFMRFRLEKVRRFHADGLRSMGLTLNPLRVVTAFFAVALEKPLQFLRTQWLKETTNSWS